MGDPDGDRTRADPSGDVVGNPPPDAAGRPAPRGGALGRGEAAVARLPGAGPAAGKPLGRGAGPGGDAGEARRRSHLWLGQRIRHRGSPAVGLQRRPSARLQRRVSRVHRGRGLCRRIVLDGGRAGLAAVHQGQTPPLLAPRWRDLEAAQPPRRDPPAARLAGGDQLPRGPGVVRLEAAADRAQHPAPHRGPLAGPAGRHRDRSAALGEGARQHQSRMVRVELPGDEVSARLARLAWRVLRRHRQCLAVDADADHAL